VFFYTSIDKRLKKFVIERQSDYWYKLPEMEVMPDHVHLLIDMNPKKEEYG